MFSTRKRHFAWVFGLGAALLVGAATLAQERRYSAAMVAVQDSQAVQQAIGDTLSLLKDAETGQRGFLISHDLAFLQTYAKAQSELPEQLQRLESLVVGDPEHAASARELARLSREKLDELAQRRIEADLRESEQRLRVLSEASFEGVAITRGGCIVDTNNNFATWLGRQPYELVGLDGVTVFAPEDRELVQDKSRQPEVSYEAHLLRQDGTRMPVEERGRHTEFRGETVRIAVVRDITERRRREAELKQQAELLRSMSPRDELTGLYNRRGFQEHAEQQLRQMARSKRPASVFFVDLNGMKIINDSAACAPGVDAGRAPMNHTRMLYMVIERFRDNDMVPIYKRVRDEGRSLPEGLKYIDSWIEPNFSRCFQLMECDDVRDLQRWVLERRGQGISFEFIPVVSSKETQEVVRPYLDRA